MNYTRLLILALAFSLAIIAGLYLFINKDSLVKPQTPRLGQISPEPTFVLPVALDHKAVKSMTLSYEFRGKVTEINSSGGSTIITLDTTDGRLPLFVASERTRIFKLTEDKSEGTNINEVKVGSQVSILMTYDGDWSLETIIIEPT